MKWKEMKWEGDNRERGKRGGEGEGGRKVEISGKKRSREQQLERKRKEELKWIEKKGDKRKRGDKLKGIGGKKWIETKWGGDNR